MNILEIQKPVPAALIGEWEGVYNTAPMKRLPVVVFSLFAVITAAKAASPTEELQAEVAVLQKEVASLTSANTAQSASIAALQHQVNLIAINPALGLGPFVTVSFINGPNSHAPNIYFSGANIHIVSGSGSTNDNGNPLGLGNLIIGYDEIGETFEFYPRGGSHNLIVGTYQSYQGTGNLIAGDFNVVTGSGNFVAGHLNSIIAAADDSILGGGNNEIAGPGTPLVSYSTISGGQFNQAGANFVSVLGGQSIGEYTAYGVSP